MFYEIDLCCTAVLGGGHKLGSVKMCDTIGRFEVAGNYGPTISSKAAQYGNCWSV